MRLTAAVTGVAMLVGTVSLLAGRSTSGLPQPASPSRAPMLAAPAKPSKANFPRQSNQKEERLKPPWEDMDLGE